MAKVIEQEKKVFPRDPCDKTLLLGSLKSFQRQGVILGVEKVIDPRKNSYGKASINVVLTIVGSMDKCRLYELDDDGQYIEYEDEMTGENRRKVYIDDGQLKTVFFPFYANIGKDEDGLDENTTLIITPGTSSYSFFKEALIDFGALPEDTGNEAIATDFAEIKECLDGFHFRGKYDVIKGKNRSFPYLLCERVSEDEIGED